MNSLIVLHLNFLPQNQKFLTLSLHVNEAQGAVHSEGFAFAIALAYTIKNFYVRMYTKTGYEQYN